MDMMGFDHQLIREVREEHGLKQACVGEFVNLAQNEVCRMEAGQRTVPAVYIRELYILTGDMRLARWMFPQINFGSRKKATTEAPRNKPVPPPGDPRKSNEEMLNAIQDLAAAAKINNLIWEDSVVNEADTLNILKQDRIIDRVREILDQHQRNTAHWREQMEKAKR